MAPKKRKYDALGHSFALFSSNVSTFKSPVHRSIISNSAGLSQYMACYSSNMLVILQDEGMDDHDDSAAVCQAIADAYRHDRSVLIVVGSSARVSVDDSLAALKQALSHFDAKYQSFYRYVSYDVWMQAVTGAAQVHVDALLLIAPQSAHKEQYNDEQRSWPALRCNTAVIQGSCPNVVNETDFESVAARQLDQPLKNGVNLQGNERLVERLNAEQKLFVVPTGICRQFKLRAKHIQCLSAGEQFTLAVNAFKQLVGRIAPEHPAALKLLQEVNYQNIGSMLQGVLGEDYCIDTLTVTDSVITSANTVEYISAMQAACAKRAGQALATAVVVDAQDKLDRICMALDALFPGLWAHNTVLSLSHMRRTDLESQFPSQIAIVQRYVEKLGRDDPESIPPYPACYDLLAYHVLLEVLQYRNNGKDQRDLIRSSTTNTLTESFEQYFEAYTMLYKPSSLKVVDEGHSFTQAQAEESGVPVPA